jgi:2-C-methyl-D-erythritol 4-phosphate cytidylyltransferase/2-C-methyl-D-erythritol 2,4-cyclodiphosphate synthase
MSTVALIVAAGRSTRFGGPTPKTYAMLGGRPVLSHSIIAFAGHSAIDAICVVIQEDHRSLYQRAVTDCQSGVTLLEPVSGGNERQDSVRLGLESLSVLAPDRVIIHDAARPLIAAELIDRVLAPLSAQNSNVAGSIAALPIPDTVKRAATENPADRRMKVMETLDRHTLWRAQTPQAFDFGAITTAHEQAAGNALTDDSAVAEAAGLEVVLVPGDIENFKITNSADLSRAEMMLSARLGDIRVGNGIDTHRFESGDHVMLCGVAIPHDKALQGHSDADAALHAVTDALLASIGAGDIGLHFPPSDEQWRNTASEVFASFAAEKIRVARGIIAHIDVTIVCESPRIAPYREAMQERLATITGIDPSRVSVKGTTTERLGFTGRGEGISAFATATVRLPFVRSDRALTNESPES